MSGNARILGVDNCSSKFDSNLDSNKLLAILFDSAIKNIENAAKAIEDNDFNRAHIQVIVAQEMLAKWAFSFSQESLEAKRTTQIHDYLQSILSDANIKKDTELMKAIRNLMIVIAETFCLEQDPSIFSSLVNTPLTKVFSETG